MAFEPVIVINKNCCRDKPFCLNTGLFLKLSSTRFFVGFIFFMTARNTIQALKRLGLAMNQQNLSLPNWYYGNKLCVVRLDTDFSVTFYKFVRHVTSIAEVLLIHEIKRMESNFTVIKEPAFQSVDSFIITLAVLSKLRSN